MPEAPRAALVCRAGRPFACRLSLPLWCPMGWRVPAALAIPATVVPDGVACPGGTGYPSHCGARWVACPAGRRIGGRWRCPKGGLPGWSPANPAFSLLCCPHPPAPLPGGKGGIKVIFMQGASPLASPRPSRKRHGLNLRCRCPMGGLPGRSPGRRVLAVPKGWFARLVACLPCL